MRAIAWVLLLLLASNLVGAQAGPSLPSKSSASFAGKDVRRGANVWFFSTVKVSGLGESQTKIFFRNSRIRFRANGTEYVVAGPNGSITFSPAAESAGTSLDPALQEFRTVVPLRFAGQVFLAGILYIVPDDVGLKQRTGEATWEGEFYSDTANVQLTWQWEARATKPVQRWPTFGNGVRSAG